MKRGLRWSLKCQSVEVNLIHYSRCVVAGLILTTYYLFTMDSIDQEKQWHELKETYGQMTEGGLCRVAEDAFDLTPIAQEALRAAIAERGLKIPLANTRPKPEPFGEAGETYDADRDLVPVREVWSEAEARQIKEILNANFVAWCLGPENVLDLSDFKGSFAGGVEIKTLARDARRAQGILATYAPIEESEEDREAENKKYVIVCPKCKSEEIMLEGEDSTVTENQYSWICDICGHQWKDDGIAHVV
jgi:hypothetical protein